VIDSLAAVVDECPLGGMLELGASGNQNHSSRLSLVSNGGKRILLLSDPAANVDDLAVLVFEHFGCRECMIRPALKQENLTGPGAGENVHVAIVVQVHNMWTKSDASPAGHAAVLFSLLEFHAGRQLGL